MIIKNSRWKKCGWSWMKFVKKHDWILPAGTLVEIEQVIGRGHPKHTRQILIGDHFSWYAISVRATVVRYKKIFEKVGVN